MKYITSIFFLITLIIISLPSFADGKYHRGGLHSCLQAASNLKDGYYQKLEYLSMTQSGNKTYEIEIKSNDGTEWELMCDIGNGEIYEIEREVESASDPMFSKQAKVDEKAASATALEIYPGKLVHTEYEIEADGSASYEFDIFEKPGVTYKVEVDAATGKIIEVNIESWDIGREADE